MNIPLSLPVPSLKDFPPDPKEIYYTLHGNSQCPVLTAAVARTATNPRLTLPFPQPHHQLSRSYPKYGIWTRPTPY